MNFPKNIGPFNLYEKTPNDIHYGALYYMDVELPILYSKERTIRVYLPEDFDQNKKYPLLIMADGQNIVDKYTSAFGAWEIDIHEHNLINKGYKSFIVVGIDCPQDPVHRALEYSFPYIQIEEKQTGEFNNDNLDFESHLLYEYIALKLLPFLKEHFPIADDKKDIGVGGSSMGGVFSTSLITSYPDVFGYALIFSPGFFLYSRNKVKKYLDEAIPKMKDNKLFFYCGSIGFETSFVDATYFFYRYFKTKGIPEENIEISIDPSCGHNETSWSKHFEEAIEFWFK